MRKFLLLIAVALFSTATYAQLWNASISAVGANDAVDFNSPAAMDKDGNLYVTGTLTEAFDFAGKEVAPLALGAYIAKYDVNGNELFAIVLHGSISVTAITTDADNNFYVAGSYAGEAYIADVEGVDGEYVTVTNSEEDSRTAAFIAKYDAQGNLLAVKSYEAVLPLEDYFDEMWGEMLSGINGMPYYGSNPAISISKIVAEGSKVYAQFNYTGDVAVETELTLTAKYLFVWGMAYIDALNVAVVSFDADLANAANVAVLTVADVAADASGVDAFNFVVEDENVYVAAFGVGNLVLTTSAGTEAIDFAFDGEGAAEKGAILAKVGTKVVKFSNIPNSSYANFDAINGIEVRDGKIYLAGTFGVTCAFDNSKVATGASDVFVASIDANELTADWVYTNANDEGETNKFYEEVTGVVFGKEHVYVVDAITDMNNGVEPVAKNYAVSYQGVANEGIAIPATTVAYNENNVAVINYTDATYITMFGAEVTNSIESVAVETENTVIYDLTGRRVENIANAGIYIVNGKKVIVK